MPVLYIIMGANGAGKSTVGPSYLPAHIQEKHEIFDGDKLYLKKTAEFYKSHTQSLKHAKRMALEWLFEYFDNEVNKALEENKDFVYEGHLPEDENWVTPKKFKAAGYKICIIYFGLTDTALSAIRVFDRAKQGGHNVPPYEIERNFFGNLYQLNRRFTFVDELKIIDTSESSTPKVLVIFRQGNVYSAAYHGKIPEWFEQNLPRLYEKIIEREPPLENVL